MGTLKGIPICTDGQIKSVIVKEVKRSVSAKTSTVVLLLFITIVLLIVLHSFTLLLLSNLRKFK